METLHIIELSNRIVEITKLAEKAAKDENLELYHKFSDEIYLLKVEMKKCLEE